MQWVFGNSTSEWRQRRNSLHERRERRKGKVTQFLSDTRCETVTVLSLHPEEVPYNSGRNVENLLNNDTVQIRKTYSKYWAWPWKPWHSSLQQSRTSYGFHDFFDWNVYQSISWINNIFGTVLLFLKHESTNNA